MSRSVEEKYVFLLTFLKVTDVDLWEGDALLKIGPNTVYFGFSSADSEKATSRDADWAVERVMDEAESSVGLNTQDGGNTHD